MNDLVLALGLAGWKPLLTALLFPPAPFMLLALVAASLLVLRELHRREFRSAARDALAGVRAD